MWFCSANSGRSRTISSNGSQGALRRPGDVEEERRRPGFSTRRTASATRDHPVEIVALAAPVVVARDRQAEVVRRRGDDDVDTRPRSRPAATSRQSPQINEAVAGIRDRPSSAHAVRNCARPRAARPDRACARSRSKVQTSVISVTASVPATGWPSLSCVRLIWSDTKRTVIVATRAAQIGLLDGRLVDGADLADLRLARRLARRDAPARSCDRSRRPAAAAACPVAGRRRRRR